ncbi:PIG-L family deacetylase [Patescibacteria group bacterium]|nr:PIG-L family deacetylase [Patescibacteria group bacterium]
MKNRKVLVVAAHPDDELLGVAGTLSLHIERGDKVEVLILGQGALSRDKAGEAEIELLHEQALAAARIIGIQNVRFEYLPDNAFDTVGILVITKLVERVIAEVRPDILYTHHAHDLNVDHRLTFQAVTTACRPCSRNLPQEVYTFETLSSSEWQSKSEEPFRPNVYIDISSTLEKKVSALNEYKSEMRPYPHSRSLEGVRILAQYRGLEAGIKFAEAFHLERRIDLCN